MKKVVPISEFKASTDIQGFYLCKGKHLRTTRAGELYLDLLLQDKTGEIGAKVWDRAEEFGKKFEAGDPVAVRGRVESFQDRLQLIVGRINKATPGRYRRYGFREEGLVPVSPYDPAKMLKEIGTMIGKMENIHLRKLVMDLYRQHRTVVLTLPASVALHYPYRSGYLEHVLSMAQVGIRLARHYNADVDLLLAGILLHGIGKVKELSDTLVPSYSDEGNFLGHIALGRDMIRQAAAKINDFPADLLMQLEHVVVSHEGAYDSRYRSKARTKEALLLQLLDNMDTKLNLFDKVVSLDSEEGNWTTHRNYFGTALYKGKSSSDG